MLSYPDHSYCITIQLLSRSYTEWHFRLYRLHMVNYRSLSYKKYLHDHSFPYKHAVQFLYVYGSKVLSTFRNLKYTVAHACNEQYSHENVQAMHRVIVLNHSYTLKLASQYTVYYDIACTTLRICFELEKRSVCTYFQLNNTLKMLVP